jgi:uncharacterized protein YyaL (SSP411 family)
VNRLTNETSPYLLQHAANPVDWYPWGDEALTTARVENRPILLSIGYAACHWCHVMERESFEDAATARVMNERFVCVKVDREERPDLDSVYMDAVVALTGSGGWPMTVFLTPEGDPFFGGTYFPPEPRHGLPAFQQVLLAVAEAWETQRDEVRNSSATLAEHIRSGSRLAASNDPLTADLLDAAQENLGAVFDATFFLTASSPEVQAAETAPSIWRKLGRPQRGSGGK